MVLLTLGLLLSSDFFKSVSRCSASKIRFCHLPIPGQATFIFQDRCKSISGAPSAYGVVVVYYYVRMCLFPRPSATSCLAEPSLPVTDYFFFPVERAESKRPKFRQAHFESIQCTGRVSLGYHVCECVGGYFHHCDRLGCSCPI